MIRFASLGSGSRGNATLVGAGDTLILIDCGFALAETERRLARLRVEPHAIQAILVTHEHGDHVRGVARLARKYGIAVWASPGTLAACSSLLKCDIHRLNIHESFRICDLAIQPIAVPHDAREPAQFVFGDGARRLGVLTDAGRPTAHIEASLTDLDALILECNHDRRMLAAGPYPPHIKTRVGGALGHLSNDYAGDMLARLKPERLQHIVAAHLSGENNTPELARATLAAALNCRESWIAVADQRAGLAWRTIA